MQARLLLQKKGCVHNSKFIRQTSCGCYGGIRVPQKGVVALSIYYQCKTVISERPQFDEVFDLEGTLYESQGKSSASALESPKLRFMLSHEILYNNSRQDQQNQNHMSHPVATARGPEMYVYVLLVVAASVIAQPPPPPQPNNQPNQANQANPQQPTTNPQQNSNAGQAGQFIGGLLGGLLLGATGLYPYGPMGMPFPPGGPMPFPMGPEVFPFGVPEPFPMMGPGPFPYGGPMPMGPFPPMPFGGPPFMGR
ncbi:hypothetical protein TELCIR_06343 [Teladorsagia circumcincta]|uniref:Uncharacterized protein n=1 Tax=Teladorsagia circumcincta TaxID=45464 RepID=A0A2G9UNC7_TELCI|nr:hypothetical protein TELCIR_06343 [Teladorsagia circumcincta]